MIPRHFVVKLPNESAREVVVDRVRGADIPIERAEGGALVRDPANNAMLFQSA